MKRVVNIFSAIIITTFLHATGFAQSTPILQGLQKEITSLIDNVKYSIVTISSHSTRSYIVDKNEGIRSLFGSTREEKKDDLWVIGSGIIYNEDGYVITKSSMLAGFEKIKVTLFDKTEYEAEYIGTDESTGLAILKINAEGLKPVHFGNSDASPFYSLIMVLGNSMGISPFPSLGFLTGMTKQGLFIISAQINPGCTGAGVFNLKGELIGIVSAQLDTDVWLLGPAYGDYAQHFGIALVSNQVRQKTEEIIKMQHEQKGWLGIDVDSDSLVKGKIVVRAVIKGSPAERSGLKKGDWLLKYNESYLKNIDQFANLIENTKPGSIVSVDFIRDNRPLKVFPQIAHKKPYSFNPNKPHLIKSTVSDYQSQSFYKPSIILSPERFNQINQRMMQMENEIKELKTKLKQYQ